MTGTALMIGFGATLLERRVRAICGCALALVTCADISSAQSQTLPLAPPPNGPRQTDARWVAFTGATAHVSATQTINNATLVMRDGRIVSVTAAGVPPAGAMVRDVKGLHIYPGFIDPYIEIDVPRPDPDAPGAHWNARVTPQRRAIDHGLPGSPSGLTEKQLDTLRSMGFVAAGIAPRAGVVRGQAAVVSLGSVPGNPALVQPRVYSDSAFQSIGFDTFQEAPNAAGPGDDPRWGRYPDSQMGAIALIRQTLSDTQWQAAARAAGTGPAARDCLDELASVISGESGASRKPVATAIRLGFDVDNELEALRAADIAKEFNTQSFIIGSGLEFRRISALSAAKLPIVIPLNYPKAPRVQTLGEAESVDLTTLINYEQAPTNAARLDAAGLTIALTTSKVSESAGGREVFRRRLDDALRHGLKPDRALAMLTSNAAGILGLSDQLGSLERGKIASFVLADGPLLTAQPDAPEKDEPGYVRPGRILDVYIDGARHVVGDRERADIAGIWTLEVSPAATDERPTVRTLEIEAGSPPKITVVKTVTEEAGKSTRQTAKATSVRLTDDGTGALPTNVTFAFEHEPIGEAGVYTFTGRIEPADAGAESPFVLRGQALRTGGQRLTIVGRRTGDLPKETPKARIDGVWTGPGGLRVEIGQDRDPKITREGKAQVTRVTSITREGDEPQATLEVTSDGGSAQSWVVRTIKDRSGEVTLTVDAQAPITLVRERRKPESEAIKAIPQTLGLPLGPYALAAVPDQKTFILKNGTVWTASDRGIIENGTVIISGGKLAVVGTGADASEWLSRVRLGEAPIEIDCTGKHIAPGIIDCHSHTGISRGVNESGQAVTAEVRIGDVTDPDSISWYRQLAAGVTTVNNLHGSANPIGGQNQVNKIRWGCTHPDDMHFEGAIPGIKFALGENVKQSNWGDRNTSRYPQTRMGVESILRDRFTAAKEYLAAGKAGEIGPGKRVRRDLELEALAEILDGQRLIHCHSYRQDEILMLCRLSQEMNFRIGTFQHGLEVYKVADEVKKVAIGASLFSDWWGFKVEVQDGIPAAGPLQSEVGVLTSYNSDSDEMVRRMNIEAGKAVKYSSGKVSPHEALKYVTINPAKQLMIDKQTGTLDAGKDADVAIWSGSPVSSLSRCERTFVDGRELFSLAMDQQHRASIAKERARIIQKILSRGSSGSNTGSGGQSGSSDAADTDTSDSLQGRLTAAQQQGRRAMIYDSYQQFIAARRQHILGLLQRGLDPRFHRSGVCGCDGWQFN